MRFIRHTNGLIRAQETTTYDGHKIIAGTLGGYISSVRNLAQSGVCWVFPGASVEGDAYVSGNALIRSDSVIENAKVYGNAVIAGGIVAGSARVLGDAFVQSGENGFLRSRINENSNWTNEQWQVFTATQLTNFRTAMATTLIGIDTFLATKRPDGIKLMSDEDWDDFGNIKRFMGWSLWNVSGTVVAGEAHVAGKAVILNNAKVIDKARVQGNAMIDGGMVKDDARVFGKAIVYGLVKGKSSVYDCTFVNPHSVVKCDARFSGCSKLIDAVLDCNAVVYGNNEIEDEIITDAGLVTACPGIGVFDFLGTALSDGNKLRQFGAFVGGQGNFVDLLHQDFQVRGKKEGYKILKIRARAKWIIELTRY